MRRFVVALVVGVSLCVTALVADEVKEKITAKFDCTVYTKPYKVTEHGAFPMPAGVKWKVMPRYVGRNEEGGTTVDDRLTLVLVDEKNKFWPVISKLTDKDAEQLQRDLAKVIAERKDAERKD